MRHLSAVLALLALTLAGCGGGNGGGSSTAGPAVPDGISVLAGVPEGGGSIFSDPESVAVDRAGSIYVVDSGNHAIRKISPTGVVTTVAGKPGTWGSADGIGPAARFYQPEGIAIDVAENLYVTDTGNFTLRKIAPDGTVTTLAGTAGSSGRDDGVGNAGRFDGAGGIAADPTGNIFVSDFDDNTIRKISPASVVTTFAGTPGVSSRQDGRGPAAGFNTPRGLAIDATGRVYVADSANQRIRTITPDGVVSTLAGTGELGGEVDGPAATAQFNEPTGIAVDATGNVYVADQGNFQTPGGTIRKISPAGEVTTLAGTAGVTGAADGVGAAASFNFVGGLAVDAAGDLFAADLANNEVRKITATGVVTTVAGTPPPPVFHGCTSADGVGADARFCYPGAIAADRSGNLYVADTFNDTIRKITPAGVVSTVAGQPGVFGARDGVATSATFNGPSGIAVDADGTIYVADISSHLIRKISPAGMVSTLAGADWEDGVPGFGGRPGSRPTALVVDGAGTVYVVDVGMDTVRKVSTTGVVTTPLGLAPGGFQFLCGIAIDAVGNLYLGTSTGVSILAPNGTLAAVAGSGELNAVDGVGAQASFSGACDLALDDAGRVLVIDRNNNTIRRIARDGTVTTIVGQGGSGSVVVGPLPGALDGPIGLAIDAHGVLYTSSENAILRIKLRSP
ncbi:MAG TPA: hypothetical protein VF304_02965 [Casimicrobiaceae bacterium]